MNKYDFMIRLAQLLDDIPQDEKEAAMEYYENYFEDAGVLNERAVLEELGSPEKIAASIKKDLFGEGEATQQATHSYYGRSAQNNEYKQSYPNSYNKQPSQTNYYGQTSQNSYNKQTSHNSYNGQSSQNSYNKQSSQNDYYGQTSQNSYNKQSSQYDYYGQTSQNAYNDQTTNRKSLSQQISDKLNSWSFYRENKTLCIVLFIIAAVISFPLWGGIIGSLIGLAFGFLGILIAAITVCIAFALVGLLCGIPLMIIGIVTLPVSIAAGLILFGIGAFFACVGTFSVLGLYGICGCFIPWCFVSIRNLVTNTNTNSTQRGAVV